MRYLILSDLHANWEALTAVIQDAGDQYDSVLCCGDIVGYGADPNAVAEWVQDHASVTIRGNHDRACASLDGIDWFNPFAQDASRWTHRALTESNRAWLNALPQGPVLVGSFQVVHGSPSNEDEYVISVPEAGQALARSDASLTFFGHTHLQCGFEYRRMRTRKWKPSELKMTKEIEDTAAYLVNPGSVGQPRDGDPRAAYALFDQTERLLVLRRVSYDIATTQQKILEAHLPAALAQRLSFGN